MRTIAKAALGVLMFTGATFSMMASASAYGGISFGFGGPGYTFGDPCDYYDYYNAPPPWGLPPDYCEYPVYSEPVFFDGIWYRGPIYYRWTHGRRMFWLHGGWRSDEWRGGARPSITWQDRGGWKRDIRPGLTAHGGLHNGPWNDRPTTGGNRFRGVENSPWSGGNRGYLGNGPHPGGGHGHH